MLDWLLQSDFNTQVTAAIWSTIVAVGSTLVLFAYTLGLRVSSTIAERRRVPLIARWRRIFADAVVTDAPAARTALPAIRSYQHTDVMQEWNLIRTKVTGNATDNLISLAEHLEFPAIARRMLHKRQTTTRLLAIQTLGHLKDRQSWSTLVEAVASNNSTISIVAAAALVDIDPKSAVQMLVPLISVRQDWLQTRVAMFLRTAGSELISQPMFRAIRSADPEGQIQLMKFAGLMEADVVEALADELVKSSTDARVLASALELLNGYRDLPRIDELAVHEAWIVRLRVAQILGRAGSIKHLPLLESLLADPEWWVRYRAAQAITSLPFLGPNALRQLQQRQTDHYARDILSQAFSEAGLS